MRQPSSSFATARRGGGEGGSTATTTSKVGLKRGPWTPEEDELLANYIKKEGEGRWRVLPKRAGLHRCGKSCRLRWMNYLRPSVKRGQIAPDEEDLILRLHRLLGNRWSLIAGRIPGRTDNEIKNYWNTHLSKKLISQGIDPRTHKPLNPNITCNISPPDDKPLSSKLANNIPNPNPNPGSSSLEEPLSNGRAFVNKGSIGHNYHGGGVNSSVSGMGLRSDHNGLDNEDGTDDINYCTDDELSWLLNSLINNEDTLNSSTHQVQQQQTKMIIPPQTTAPTAAGSDALIFPPQAFGFAAGWDAPIMSAFNQNDPKIRLSDHVDKKF